ncbi:tRNA-uridine aminocarboxypropyltransferase [Aquabacterium sp. OR-4]|uniref:tRNA-uridine aminocarboxypropyltransferase n=1 Tax=Aquabacterium sp. OR-4 TaxID=2978127 RepID=UPI0021B27596|nr:tRNA-uridine aminocarboxypropyltransferase [Aquabacterium sp. OR-4]MDT7833738.1 tRNA-uridine aminocarboxypropyltransferase [Aquabacterium sp. OR-4]
MGEHEHEPEHGAGLSPRRTACPGCLRARCVCHCLARPGLPWQGPVALLLLQHPREQREAKGTARLLHQAVAGSRLLVGEQWARAPADEGAAAPAPGGRHDILLYPATPGDAALPAPPPLPPAWLADPARLRLVVIDGTWRKSRRMLYQSPWLQGLPRLALAAPPPSRYRIRRARGEGQLSTFEAALLALAQLAPAHDPGSALWPVFEAFVAAQLAGQTGAAQPG